MDIEGYHKLPGILNAAKVAKVVIVKFVNDKHAESIPSKKVYLSFSIFSRLNVINKFDANTSLFLIVAYRDSVKICNEGR